MAISFNTAPLTKGQNYISNRRLFLTQAGEVVEEGDARAHSLLVGKGCALPYGVALRHGLINNAPAATPQPTPGQEVSVEAEQSIEDDDMNIEAKHIKGPPQTKDIKGPKETKNAQDFYPVAGGKSPVDDQPKKD